MAQPTPSFFEELPAAARGSLVLVLGDRQASAYFDFRQTGIVGSFIAFVVGLTVQAFGPGLFGTPMPAGIATGTMILGGVIMAVQLGVAWLILRQLGRGDGFVPFVVVQNWAMLFQGILAVATIALFGQPFAIAPDGQMMEFTTGSVPFLMLGIVALVVIVNISRLILTLRPLHVVLFVVAQLTTTLLVPPVVGGLL